MLNKALLGVISGQAPYSDTPPPAAFNKRYWRLDIQESTGAGGTVSIGELELYIEPWQSNVALGAVATASSFSSTQPPSDAFDGVKSGANAWRPSDGLAPSWVQADLGEEQDILQYKIFPRPSSPEPPSTWSLLYSDDGTTWAVAHEVNGFTDWGPSNNTGRVFTIQPVPGHRFWRLYCTAADYLNAGFRVAELELRNVLGGPNQALTCYPSAKNSQTGGHPRGAFDGSATTYWRGNNLDAPNWLQADFGVGNTIEVLEYTIRAPTSSANATPTAWQLQYSDNGSTWSTASSVSGSPPWAAGERRTFYV